MTTSKAELIHEATRLFEAGDAGEKQAQEALTEALQTYEQRSTVEADCKARQGELTAILADLNRESVESVQKTKTIRQKRAWAHVFDRAKAPDYARQYDEASALEHLVKDSLELIAVVELPEAIVRTSEAEMELAYARAAAVRAEALDHMLKCLIAARPLMHLNGGSIEFVLDQGKTGLLFQAVIDTYVAADHAQASYDDAKAKHAVNVRKLQ